MGNERQIEMLRAKVVASMPLRKSQQSKNSVAVEEREEGELSAEDEESLVPAMGTRAAPSRNRVPKLETRTQSSIEEKSVFPTSFKVQAAQPTTQVSIVNKSQLLNMFSAPAPPLASLQGPMPVRYPAPATVSKSQSQFFPTDIGLARHQGTPMQIDANSIGGQMNSSMNKLREVAPAASMQPVMPSFGHPITHGRKRGRSREAITAPFTHSKVAPPVAPQVGAIAMSSGLHSPQPASAPVSGVHSEVEAFLASLHLPVVPTSSTPFSEENFVIKFDSDSDSEGEQQLIRSNQDQFTSATSGQQSTSLSSQSPADMRSEIYRMKKQIALMERSKAKTNSNSNLTSQSVTLSKNIGPRTGTVNLENLRQQIAAKENELLERRQRLAVTSPMEKPHLPVGKVLEQRNSGATRVGDGQTRLGSAVQLTLVEQAVQNTGAEEGKLVPCGPRASVPGSAILSDARDVEGDVRLMFQKSGAAQTLKRAASEVYLSGELHKLRKVELPSVSQPQHLVSAAQSSTAQHGKGTLGVESISSTQADGHAILKSKLEDGHVPVHTHTSTPVTKKSQTLSTRTNLSNPSGESASVPAEDMTFLVGSQGSQDTSTVISSTGQAVWASVEQGPITAFVVSRPDSGLSSKDGVLPKDAQGGGLSPSGPQVFVDTIPGESPVPQECGNEHALGLEAEIPSSTSQQINVFEPDAPPQATVSSVGTMVELSTASSAGTPIHVAESTPSRSIPSTVMLSTPTSSLPAAREEVRRVVPSFTIKSPIYSPITTATGYDSAIPSLHLPGYALWPPLHQLQAAKNQLEPSGIHGPIWSIDSAREGGMQLLQRLQEDEDAVDKALEEAQVRRRKCEVSEREARRLYQDAKTALASANALCDALLHQRKLLSAQLHAAELRMLQLPHFAVPTDRQLTSDHHAQLTELPLEFSSAAWTNQRQSPPRVHVKGNLRQGTCVELEGQAITNSPPEDCQSMGSEMTMPAAVLKESPISKRSSDNSSRGHLLGLHMVAPTVGIQEVHSNLHLYPAQNVAQDRLNVQSHEISDLSLDHWRVSTVVNKSDGVSPVHTVVKDSKVVKVRMPAAAADLEGLCEDSGTNGSECQRSSEEKNLQHLTQNGVGVSAPIENLPGGRSQKPVTQLGDTEKKDSDEINTPPNEQVQSADREQPLAGWGMDKDVPGYVVVQGAGKEYPMSDDKLGTSEIAHISLKEEDEERCDDDRLHPCATKITITPLQNDIISLAPDSQFGNSDGPGFETKVKHGIAEIPEGDEGLASSLRFTTVCLSDGGQTDGQPKGVASGGDCTTYVEDGHANEKAQELPVPLILKDTAMIATQDSQSDSEEDGHDDDISNEAIPILLKCKPEITGLRALADNDANNGLLSEQDVHVQGESLVDSTNTGLLKSSDSLTCATKDATVQQLEYELAPGSLKAFQFQIDKEKMDLLSQKVGHSQKEGQGFGREQQSGGDEHSQVQKGSIIEPVNEMRALSPCQTNCLVAGREPSIEGMEVSTDEQLPSSVLYGMSCFCLEKPSEESLEVVETSLTTSMSLRKYESPLRMFRSYRLTSQFGSAWHFKVESKTWSHDIDIWKLLCKFEHRGKCNNDACLGQHVADYTLDHTGLLSQLQKYVNPEKQLGDDGMSPRAIEAAIAAIVDEAQTSANLTQNKVASGKLFLEDKLQWNKELSVPIYQIGPYIVLPDQTNLCSRVRCLLGFQSKVVSFSSSLLSPALCRLLPPDVPCLLAAVVEDSSITSPAEESSWRYIEDAGDSQEVAEEHVLKHPGDIEAWLELALTIIDYDLTCQDVDAQKEALYILSRALEANPSVVVLWVVYIGLFYNRESSIGIDDMFHHAVGFNPASYELWLLLINSRLKLGDCLDAYKLALQGLCSLEEEDREEQSACILDLTLQMLNCMCIASQTLMLNGWVDELVNHEGSNRRILAFLIPNDSCILWVGCAYAVAFGELPREFVQRFGCNQELPFDLNWDRRSEVQHGTGGPAIKLLHAGMNCLVGVAEQQSQHALAVNYVQCLSLYRGLNQALMMAHQLWERHPGCLELVLLVARLEGNKGGVAMFEQAVRCWPQPRVGLQRLWNQYALHVLQWEGKSSALHVLYRCASRASALDSSALRDLREDSKVRDSLVSIAENDNSDGNFSSIGEDAVFAWLNLALFEALSGERGHAQAAVERSLKAAVSREDVRHCWREMAALTLLSDVGDLRQPSHVLDLLDRCCMETSMHWKLTPLSSQLSKNISKRHLRSFIDFLLGPAPVDYSVVNSFVQQYIAKGLKLGMHTSRLVEGVLAVMPGNVEVVLPLCRLLLGHNLSNTQEFAAAVWTISIVLSTLLQACPQAPEQDWVEVGKLLSHLGDKSSLQEFYQHALVVYPFSAVLRHSLLEVQQSQEARSGAGEEALLQG